MHFHSRLPSEGASPNGKTDFDVALLPPSVAESARLATAHRPRRAFLLLLPILSLLGPAAGHALVLPDPTGIYEAQCWTGPNIHPVSCATLPTPPPLRSSARLFERGFIPANCASEPCTKARTLVEGQVTVVRSYTRNIWNAEEMICEPDYDRPGFRYTGDVYDVEGEIVWHDFASGANTLTLAGDISSEPGDVTYIPSMKFTGSMLVQADQQGTVSQQACVQLSGAPSLNMTIAYDAPAENDPPPPCVGSVGYAVPNCWRRRSGALPTASGTLAGKAVSLVPTLTETDHEVHQATVVLYEQFNGRLREPLHGESSEDYRAHLIASGRKEVGRFQIERGRDGTYTFGEPGRFEFADVPLFRFQPAGGGRWGTVWYTVEVEGAETDEEVPQQGGGTLANKLLFRDGRAINVRPEEAPVVVGLDDFGSVGAKLELIDRLSGKCVLHYAPVEDDARNFVDAAASGAITDELDEAIRRGAWAERSALSAVSLADELIEVALGGLASLLAELYDDRNKFHRGDIAYMRGARDRLKAAPGAKAVSDFQLNPQPVSTMTRHAISGSGNSQLLAQSDLASAVKKTLKSIKPLLVVALERNGHPDAAGAAETIIRILAVMADAIETRTGAGVGKSFVKLLIAEAVKQAKPILLDVTPLSYCGFTSGSLQTSVDQMSAWNVSNDDVYTKDRVEVVRVLTEMNRSATDILGRMRAAQEVSAGFDTVEDAAAVIGLAVKWAKVVETFAKWTKYALAAESVLLPFIEVYGYLPGRLEGAVEAAYAQASPLGAAATTPQAPPPEAPLPGSGGALLAVTTSDTALVAILAQISEALAEDDLGSVTQRIADPVEPSFVIARAAHERQVEALFAQASAAAGAFNLEAPLREATAAWSAVQLAQAELAETLRRLVVDAYSGGFSGIADPDYLRGRDTARALIGVLDHRLSKLRDWIDALRSAVTSNTFGPVVFVEAFAPISNSTGESLVQSSPETFTFTARVTNLGDEPLSGLSVGLALESPHDSVSIVGAAVVPVAGGTLQPFDGIDNGGGDEAVLQWQISYSGNFAWELIVVAVEVLEHGAEPVSFAAAGAGRVLPIDASVADVDGDGLPDDYESEFGLDLSRDDSQGDPDLDKLTSLVELNLGTNPSEPDTDSDGIGDGDEVFPQTGGFGTDPLAADTDGDGIDDGADGAPLDGGSATALPDSGEPSVVLSESLLVLTPEDPVQAVEVSNGGGATLLWAATRGNASLVEVSPGTGDLHGENGSLYVTVPDGFEFAAAAALVSTVTVTDVSGAIKDSRTVKVVLGFDASAALCGHGTDASIGFRPTTSDALVALRTSVGSSSCAACRCDVDSSGSVAVSDALKVLRAAVGLAGVLDCPAC
ncbi:MAG: hypothetical protein ABR587_15500 [Candidatus Binatia bacterium]